MRGAEARSYKGSVRGRRSSGQVPRRPGLPCMARVVGLTLGARGRNATPTSCLRTISLSLFELLPDLQFGDPYTIHARLTASFHVPVVSWNVPAGLPLQVREMPRIQRVKLAHRSWLYRRLTYAGVTISGGG
jgi:hypothetical protein